MAIFGNNRTNYAVTRLLSSTNSATNASAQIACMATLAAAPITISKITVVNVLENDVPFVLRAFICAVTYDGDLTWTPGAVLGYSDQLSYSGTNVNHSLVDFNCSTPITV